MPSVVCPKCLYTNRRGCRLCKGIGYVTEERRIKWLKRKHKQTKDKGIKAYYRLMMLGFNFISRQVDPDTNVVSWYASSSSGEIQLEEEALFKLLGYTKI